MLLKRNFAAEIYSGQLSGDLSDVARIFDVSDKPTQKEVIGIVDSCGSGQIVASGSLTVPLPDGYVNASYAQLTVIAKGLIRVKTTSPDHAASTTLVQGSAARPGMHQCVEHFNSITIENTSSTASVKVHYSLVQLPDISDEDNFRGLQKDGTWTEIT